MTRVVIELGDVEALRSLPEGSVLLDRASRAYQLHVDRSGRSWRTASSIAWQGDAGLAKRGPLTLIWHPSPLPPIVAPSALDPRLVELGRRVLLRRRPGAPDELPAEIEAVFVHWIAGHDSGGVLDRDARLVLEHDGQPLQVLVRNYSVHSAPALSIR